MKVTSFLAGAGPSALLSLCAAAIFLYGGKWLSAARSHDEPTSALDPENERMIAETLSTALRGRTAIVITHPPALARIADQIVEWRAESHAQESLQVANAASGL